MFFFFFLVRFSVTSCVNTTFVGIIELTYYTTKGTDKLNDYCSNQYKIVLDNKKINI